MRWIILSLAIVVCTPLGKRVGDPRRGTSLQNKGGLLFALNAGGPVLNNPKKSRLLVKMQEGIPSFTAEEMETLQNRINRIEQQGSPLLPTPEKYVAALSDDDPANLFMKFYKEQPEAMSFMQETMLHQFGYLADEKSAYSATFDHMAELLMGLFAQGYMLRNAQYAKTLGSLLGLTTMSRADLSRRFDEIDTDKSGYIEKDEMITLLDDMLHGAQGCTDEAIEANASEFYNLVDANRDGRVSKEEFFDVFERTSTDDFRDASPAIQEPTTPDHEVYGKMTVAIGDAKVEIDAETYMQSLKEKYEDLQKQLIDLKKQKELESMAPARSLKTYVHSMSETNLEAMHSRMSEEVKLAMGRLINNMLRADEVQADTDGKAEVNYRDLRTIFLHALVLGYQLREREADELHKQSIAASDS